VRDEHAVAARAIVDANQYMTLATAASTGEPWASPVWFATADYHEFFWVSKPGARHSRNLAVRPEIAIVIFDSQVRPGAAKAVYISAVAGEVERADVANGLEVYSARSLAKGLQAWAPEEVLSDAAHRLYRASASEVFVLTERDERLPISL
jgi:pyridoxine/pyridoxamine 5'-phosphate oxidase